MDIEDADRLALLPVGRRVTRGPRAGPTARTSSAAPISQGCTRPARRRKRPGLANRCRLRPPAAAGAARFGPMGRVSAVSTRHNLRPDRRGLKRPPPRLLSETDGGAESMAHWLVKSEPDAFSWDQQVAERHRALDRGAQCAGVQQPQGDEAGATGPSSTIPTSARRSSAWSRWRARPIRTRPTRPAAGSASTCKAVGPLPQPVTLAAIKADPEFADLALVRMSRLSVMPVSDAHWARLCKLGGWTRT